MTDPIAMVSPPEPVAATEDFAPTPVDAERFESALAREEPREPGPESYEDPALAVAGTSQESSHRVENPDRRDPQRQSERTDRSDRTPREGPGQGRQHELAERRNAHASATTTPGRGSTDSAAATTQAHQQYERATKQAQSHTHTSASSTTRPSNTSPQSTKAALKGALNGEGTKATRSTLSKTKGSSKAALSSQTQAASAYTKGRLHAKALGSRTSRPGAALAASIAPQLTGAIRRHLSAPGQGLSGSPLEAIKSTDGAHNLAGPAPASPVLSASAPTPVEAPLPANATEAFAKALARAGGGQGDIAIRIEDGNAGSFTAHVRLEGSDLIVRLMAQGSAHLELLRDSLSEVHRALSDAEVVSGQVHVSADSPDRRQHQDDQRQAAPKESSSAHNGRANAGRPDAHAPTSTASPAHSGRLHIVC